MTLLRTGGLNAIAVGIKLLVGLFLNKVLAVFVGPAGYAVIGQFQNAITMITGFASGAINNGIVKYTAEYCHNEHLQVRVWQTATRISVCCSLIFSGIIIVFNQQLAEMFLKNAQYGSIFVIFASFLLFFVLNALLLAILNGKKEVGRYVAANISGSIVMAVITGVLARSVGLYGALVALSVNQSVTFFATVFWCRQANWFQVRSLWGVYDPLIARRLGRFALMALTSAAVVPLSQILIRNRLGQEVGWVAAGHWQGIWKISEMYLMVVTTTLGVYYLPRISEISDRNELRREILRGYKIIFPVAVLGAGFIFFLRDYLIHMLFTKDFIPMRDHFTFQLIGDVLKIASWLLGYVLWGKALARIFIITEVIFSLLFVLFSFACIKKLGIDGATLAYLMTYALYFITLIFVLTKTRTI